MKTNWEMDRMIKIITIIIVPLKSNVLLRSFILIPNNPVYSVDLSHTNVHKPMINIVRNIIYNESIFIHPDYINEFMNLTNKLI